MKYNKISKRAFAVIPFACLFAYLLSFVFEGKVLYSLLEHYDIMSNIYIISAIVAHFLGLFSCGFWVKSPQMAKRVMTVAMLLCFVVTISFFFKPSLMRLIELMVIGYASGSAVASWGYFLKISTPKNERIKSCADVLIISNLIMILINVVVFLDSYMAGLALALFCLAVGTVFTCFLPVEATYKSAEGENKLPANLKRPLAMLFLFVVVITVNSGLMYQVINPAFEHLNSLVSWYWAVPYIIALVVIRKLSIKIKCSMILYIGMAMIMGAFICFMVMGRDTADYLVIDTLMLGACGIFDLFWWSIIGEMLNYSKNPVKVFGIGISANVFGVLCGDLLGVCITSFALPGAQVTVIALCVVCVTLVILPVLNSQLGLLLKSHAYLTVHSDLGQKQQDIIVSHIKTLDPLTERENEVLQLILSGKSNKEIANTLYISENTVKTHARRIYSKYDVGGRAELISKILKNKSNT